jgi:tripartite-type tricarboxylate transporter receptor subunit TctC
MIGSPASTLPHVKGGRLRLIAVTTPKRSATRSQVPTLAESVPGYEFTGWMGFPAPVKVSRESVEKPHRGTLRIVYLPHVKQKLQPDAAEPVGRTPEAFTAHPATRSHAPTKVVKARGIKLEQ